MADAKALYLDLMKQCLTYSLYGGEKLVRLERPRSWWKRVVFDAITRGGFKLMRERPFDPQVREEGRDWPPPLLAHTMIGRKRLDNLQFCVEEALAGNVPGDFIEAGAWRGGASIFMRAILKAYGVTDRSVWVADSFGGLPPPKADKYPADRASILHTIASLAVPLEEVQANFRRYGLLDEQVRFLNGWFAETLPSVKHQRWAVIRLDGDMYESTMDGLVNLYPNLSVGGYIIIDDYGAIAGCRQAVQDFRDQQGIRDPIRPIDWTGVFWQRT